MAAPFVRLWVFIYTDVEVTTDNDLAMYSYAGIDCWLNFCNSNYLSESFGLVMRQADKKAAGCCFSISSSYMDLFNIIQLAWDIKWIIEGNVANHTDILRVKMFTEQFRGNC